MRLALLLALAALAGSPAAPAAAEPAVRLAYTTLPAGRYEIAVKGMLCAVCARAIRAQWAALPAVEKVSVDYATGKAVLTVRLDGSLPVDDLKKVLTKAELVANLRARFSIASIAYLP
ncbi:MAG: heavy-metal-associated domain-containing protein [Elusimicrobia bacterium]|nr:heavy-metal-associated domain-containing protein [Elusimicrobiota bacterium]